MNNDEHLELSERFLPTANNVNDLSFDNLVHIFEYLDRKSLLISSSVNRYFNRAANCDYLWIGKHGFITQTEVDYIHEYSKQKKIGNLKLWRPFSFKRIENLQEFEDEFLKETNLRQNLNETNLEEGEFDYQFKKKYAIFKKEQLIRLKTSTIEGNLKSMQKMEQDNLEIAAESGIVTSLIIFFTILTISICLGLILVSLSLDEYIPNEIGTYFWLFSWLSFGLVPIPVFYGILLYFADRHGFYPFWTKNQMNGIVFESMFKMFITNLALWTWLPYIFVVCGLKYALFQDSELLSYIAIPGYVIWLVSYLCCLPFGGIRCANRPNDPTPFCATLFYGFMELSLQVFIILLIGKIDGLEYLINIPFSIIFIPLQIALMSFPIGFFVTIFVSVLVNEHRIKGAIGYAGLCSFLIGFCLSPVNIYIMLLGFVLDSFILQSVFPFIAVLGTIASVIIAALLIALAIGCCLYIFSCIMDCISNH